MDNHTYIGKRKVASTNVSDFTDYQGIGQDPLYKRYDSVYSVIKKAVDAKYAHFIAASDYSGNDDVINWYIDDWTETPIRLTELDDENRERYLRIKNETIAHYKNALENLSGEELIVMACVLRYINDNFIYCCDDKVFLVAWGMTPDRNKHIPVGELIHGGPARGFKILFDEGRYGKIAKTDTQINRKQGYEIISKDIPEVEPNDGYEFIGWTPNPLGYKVEENTTFKAEYRKIDKPIQPPVIPPIDPDEPEDEPEPVFNCRFEPGAHGSINGWANISKEQGTRITSSDIPSVSPDKGYTFTGWDREPMGHIVNSDEVYYAQYEKTLPWYKRFRNRLTGKSWLKWFTGKGCLKWLLWILLAVLLVLLLSWLLNGCHSCHRETNGVAASEKIISAGGDTIDNNGVVAPIGIEDGRLPDGNGIAAPIRGEDGAVLPIVRDPGVPAVIANRLFLFLENENDNIDALAADFKKTYPGEQYEIIGFDREVKSLVIQVPEAERDEIRRTINARIPNHQFIVFDEEIYELNDATNSTFSSAPGWHLQAVNAQKAWTMTKGNSSVVVAVVDDGIDAGHPIFDGKIVDAYNVFTQNNSLSRGDGHGTHTAGLAVGSLKYLNQGAAGIAPECKLMPIQVFDNGMCPLSALVSGIMYAVHKGADVVNVSIGPSFKGLNQLPEESQIQIAQTRFKNVEKLWNRVCKLAAKKNTIIVFAAGNDDILSSIPPENRSAVAITVGAVDQKLYPTDFTNYGPCTDISAPGKDIYSSFPGSNFKSCDGTSMSAPIVTGAIALMKSIKKDLTVKQAYNVLYRTGKDVYGNMPPMVNVEAALVAVKKGDFSEPTPRPIRPIPGTDTPIIDEPDPGVVIPPEGEGQGNDYDEIRRLIEFYKQKIAELEGQLPKNKR